MIWSVYVETVSTFSTFRQFLDSSGHINHRRPEQHQSTQATYNCQTTIVLSRLIAKLFVSFRETLIDFYKTGRHCKFLWESYVLTVQLQPVYNYYLYVAFLLKPSALFASFWIAAVTEIADTPSSINPHRPLPTVKLQLFLQNKLRSFLFRFDKRLYNLCGNFMYLWKAYFLGLNCWRTSPLRGVYGPSICTFFGSKYFNNGTWTTQDAVRSSQAIHCVVLIPT